MNKRYPKYGQPGFHVEYCFLCELPKTAEEAYRQLHALGELARNGPHSKNGFSPVLKMSKRRIRVLRTYWALYRKENSARKLA